jgi:hypothetical protein
MCSDSQADLQTLEASRVSLKQVWKCQQALCAMSSWNKVTLLWVPNHSGIQGNTDVDAMAREGLSSQFLSSEPAISISPCIGRIKVKEWIQQSKLFIGRPPNKLSWDIMALDRKE